MGNYHSEEPSAPPIEEIETYVAEKSKPSAPLIEGPSAPLVEELDDCSICFDELEKYILTECKHRFHLDCIKKISNNRCPLCRQMSTAISNARNHKYVKIHTVATSNSTTSDSASSDSASSNTTMDSNTAFIEQYANSDCPEFVLLEALIYYIDSAHPRNNIDAILALKSNIETFIEVTKESKPKLSVNVKIRENMISGHLDAYLNHNNPELDKTYHIANIYKYTENIKNIIINHIEQNAT